MYVSLNVPIINDIKTQINEAKERLYIKPHDSLIR